MPGWNFLVPAFISVCLNLEQNGRGRVDGLKAIGHQTSKNDGRLIADEKFA